MKQTLPDLILLDTYIWVWLMEGSPRLAHSKALPLIQQGAKEARLRVSIISVWEVAKLESKGRIHFPLSCANWIDQALKAPGLSLVPITPEIAIESTRLPGHLTTLDPVDHLLIATARNLNASLLTQDKAIQHYGQQNCLHLLPI